MSNTSNSTPKRGRGRPKGATSLMNVTVGELCRLLNSDAVVPISRVFGEKLGASGTTGSASQVHRMANKPVVPVPVSEDIDVEPEVAPIEGEEI